MSPWWEVNRQWTDSGQTGQEQQIFIEKCSLAGRSHLSSHQVDVTRIPHSMIDA